MQSVTLKNRATVPFASWAESFNNSSGVHRILVAVSGYESRSRCWVECAARHGIMVARSFEACSVYGMAEHADVLARPENNNFYIRSRFKIEPLAADDPGAFHARVIKSIQALIRGAQSAPCEIHVDYSSMPRSWYCSLPRVLESALRTNDTGFLWYSPGFYPENEYPTVGVDDFRVFSGQASLVPKFRTHLMGLGFDRVRSQAIWSVIDPENLVAFYADPASVPRYVDRVRKDNEDVLRAARHELALPLSDIALSIDRLASVAREFRGLGDVILVPDGPKPLVLAASLIPELIGRVGIVCFHVARRGTKAIEPVDVVPNGEPCALRFAGSEPTDGEPL